MSFLLKTQSCKSFRQKERVLVNKKTNAKEREKCSRPYKGNEYGFQQFQHTHFSKLLDKIFTSL